MADIQQWRRRIQPASKARTLQTPGETEEAEDYFSPPTPKRKVKPKLSSYFTHNAKSSLHDEVLPPPAELPSWPLDQVYPDPKAEDAIDAVTCKLMAEPYERLDTSYHSSLMLIFEDWVKLRDERNQLQEQFETEVAATQSLISRFNMAEKDWHDERQDFKYEVKRLEILLSKASKRGLAEVTLARQDSVLRTRRAKVDKKETVFEFLEKTKHHEEPLYTTQRAAMKPLLLSPSDKDKRTSQSLSQKKSFTNIHAELPFGTPPMDSRFSLTNASLLEKAARFGRKRAVTSSDITTSDETFSTFSCVGDLLPDEAANAEMLNPTKADDFSAIEQIARAVARRRHADPARVLPQLLKLFGAQEFDVYRSMSMPATLDDDVTTPRAIAPPTTGFPERSSSRYNAMVKASEIFHKLRPQLTIDTDSASRGTSRRFSFEPGDDSSDKNAGHSLPPYVKERILRKAQSLNILVDQETKGATAEQPLSPVVQSPTASAPLLDGRPPSRIPTAVFTSGSLARPRQEREDSASSLLTIIKAAEGSNRRNSLTSSFYSSPPASREDLRRPSQAPQPGQLSLSSLRSSSSNHLLDHTDLLRGASAASARTANTSSEFNCDPRVHWQQPSGQSYPISHDSDMSGSVGQTVQENIRPID